MTPYILVVMRLYITFALAALVVSARAELIDRGNGLIYDTAINVTWLQDANLAATDTFGVSPIFVESSTGTGGVMTWRTALDFVAAMNTANYKGYHDWQLPVMTDPLALCNFSDVGGTNCGNNVDPASSQMAELYSTELGNKSFPNPDSGLSNIGPFKNVQGFYYWFGTPFAPAPDQSAWGFLIGEGQQIAHPNGSGLFVWPVLPGDVPQVPEPGNMALLLTGLAFVWLRCNASKSASPASGRDQLARQAGHCHPQRHCGRTERPRDAHAPRGRMAQDIGSQPAVRLAV